MIDIKRFECNMLQENCYIVSDASGECVVVDCGAFYDEERDAVTRYIDNNGLRPVHLLCTHGHMDHNFGADTILSRYGLRPEISAGDADLLAAIAAQCREFLGFTIERSYPEPLATLQNDTEIAFGTHRLKVIETPGHTAGSVAFYCAEEHIAFTGDTLFRGSIGRTDLPGGNMFQIIQSLRALAQLPDDTIVLPGHGERTTIGGEVAHNPYIDR